MRRATHVRDATHSVGRRGYAVLQEAARVQRAPEPGAWRDLSKTLTVEEANMIVSMNRFDRLRVLAANYGVEEETLVARERKRADILTNVRKESNLRVVELQKRRREKEAEKAERQAAREKEMEEERARREEERKAKEVQDQVRREEMRRRLEAQQAMVESPEARARMLEFDRAEAEKEDALKTAHKQRLEELQRERLRDARKRSKSEKKHDDAAQQAAEAPVDDQAWRRSAAEAGMAFADEEDAQAEEEAEATTAAAAAAAAAAPETDAADTFVSPAAATAAAPERKATVVTAKKPAAMSIAERLSASKKSRLFQADDKPVEDAAPATQKVAEALADFLAVADFTSADLPDEVTVEVDLEEDEAATAAPTARDLLLWAERQKTEDEVKTKMRPLTPTTRKEGDSARFRGESGYVSLPGELQGPKKTYSEWIEDFKVDDDIRWVIKSEGFIIGHVCMADFLKSNRPYNDRQRAELIKNVLEKQQPHRLGLPARAGKRRHDKVLHSDYLLLKPFLESFRAVTPGSHSLVQYIKLLGYLQKPKDAMEVWKAHVEGGGLETSELFLAAINTLSAAGVQRRDRMRRQPRGVPYNENVHNEVDCVRKAAELFDEYMENVLEAEEGLDLHTDMPASMASKMKHKREMLNVAAASLISAHVTLGEFDKADTLWKRMSAHATEKAKQSYLRRLTADRQQSVDTAESMLFSIDAKKRSESDYKAVLIAWCTRGDTVRAEKLFEALPEAEGREAKEKRVWTAGELVRGYAENAIQHMPKEVQVESFLAGVDAVRRRAAALEGAGNLEDLSMRVLEQVTRLYVERPHMTAPPTLLQKYLTAETANAQLISYSDILREEANFPVVLPEAPAKQPSRKIVWYLMKLYKHALDQRRAESLLAQVIHHQTHEANLKRLLRQIAVTLHSRPVFVGLPEPVAAAAAVVEASAAAAAAEAEAEAEAEATVPAAGAAATAEEEAGVPEDAKPAEAATEGGAAEEPSAQAEGAEAAAPSEDAGGVEAAAPAEGEQAAGGDAQTEAAPATEEAEETAAAPVEGADGKTEEADAGATEEKKEEGAAAAKPSEVPPSPPHTAGSA